ncbi:MAG: DUF1311 domain-containing protein [Devosiaceae bacterium]|nr:DUF1311 domain-containing protein [Devosiaceae bacterium MH13]
MAKQPALSLALVLALAVALLPTGGLAKTSRTCDDPQTQMAMNECAVQEFTEADLALNDAWDELRLARQAEPAWQLILEAQRSWLPFRDLHCEAEAARYEGGSIQPLIRYSCLASLTNQRTAQLRDFLNDP